MNLFSSQPAFARQPFKIGRLLFLLPLLIILPIAVWAVLTQRIDLRGKAATATCWNRVVQTGNEYFWPNACRGAPPKPGLFCSQVIIPLTEKEVKQYNAWVANGKPATAACGPIATTPTPRPPSPYPTPTYYPTPWATPYTTPTPTPPCITKPFTLTMIPTKQTAYAGQSVSYTVTITNNNGGGCPPTSLHLQPVAPPTSASDWKMELNNNPYFILSPGASTQFIMMVTPPISVPPQTYAVSAELIDASYTVKQSVSATLTVKQLTPTPTPTPPSSQALKFKVKFDGVAGSGAEGAKIAVKLLRNDGSIFQLTQPLTVAHLGSGVYEASATITPGLPADGRYAILIKGEKHVSRRFCRQVGQTALCPTADFITIPSPSPLTMGFDFTGLPLEPGDLPLQDGKADKADFDKIRTLLSKPSIEITDNDRTVADLNYDGTINIMDAFLMRKTLETRYDEQ